MTSIRQRPTSSTTQSSNNSRRGFTSFVTLLALCLAQGEAFQLNHRPSTLGRSTQQHHTQLSALRSSNDSRHHSRNPQQNQRGQHKTAAYYSNSADPVLSSSDPQTANSFGDRMRNMVLRREQRERDVRLIKTADPATTEARPSKINPHKPSFVHEAISLSEYKALVADERERLVVVRFYAKWCSACKRVEASFYRMAREMPDVKFVEVPVLEENANLHQGLGVPALPFCHVYSPTAGLVDELRMSKKEFKTFQQVVNTYREGQCTDLEIDEETGLFSSPVGTDQKVVLSD